METTGNSYAHAKGTLTGKGEQARPLAPVEAAVQANDPVKAELFGAQWRRG